LLLYFNFVVSYSCNDVFVLYLSSSSSSFYVIHFAKAKGQIFYIVVVEIFYLLLYILLHLIRAIVIVR